jgi:hypothetical protein
MKNLWTLSFLTFFFLLSSASAQNKRIKVKLVFAIKNDDVKSIITSKVRAELQSKNDIDIVETNPQFVMTFNSLDVKDGISISYIIAHQEKTSDSRIVFAILGNGLVTLKSSEIEQRCVVIISECDVKYFEKVRH